jgi:hypothetical protein
MKFQATFEVDPDDEPEDEALAESVEEEAGNALIDLGYSNIDVKAV